MKKFYFMLIALMAVMGAQAQNWYINGDFCKWINPWSEEALANYKLTMNSQGLYEIDLSKTATPDISGAFLIVPIKGTSADWSQATRVNSGKIKEGVSYTYKCDQNGNNINVDGTIKNAKVVLNPYAKQIIITGQSEANSFDKVYVIGDLGNGYDPDVTDYPLERKAGSTDVYTGTYSFSGTAYDNDYFFPKFRCGNVIVGPIGDDVEPTLGEAVDLEAGSSKALKLLPDTYTFTVEVTQEAGTAKVTVTKGGINGKKTIYFDDTTSQWGSVIAHYSGTAGSDDYLMEATGIANIFTVDIVGDYNKVYFTDENETVNTPTYDIVDSYIYSTTNSGSAYTLPTDYSGWYVSVYGPYNEWSENGIHPNAEGVSTHYGLAIGTGEFKVKVWDGKKDYYFTLGDQIALNTWTTVPGNSSTNMTVAGAAADDRFDVSWDCANHKIFIAKSSRVIDYPTEIWVSACGDFNTWQGNGVRPDRDGVALIEVADVNTSFKIKVYDEVTKVDEWFAIDGELALDTWTVIKGNSDSMTLPASAKSGNVAMTFECKTGKIKVQWLNAGVEGVAIDSEAAAPVYYNLQGVEVAQPAAGLYIVRRGNSVTKEVIR